MHVEPIGFLVFALGVVAVFMPPAFAMAVLAPLSLLGAATTVSGGMGNIQPGHLMLLFVVISTVLRPDRLNQMLREAVFPRPGFWVAAIAICGVMGAVILPRLMAGSTEVLGLAMSAYNYEVMTWYPLGPSSGNITQSIYLLGDLVCFLVACGFARDPSGFRVLTLAMFAYCVMDIAFAAVDIATFTAGVSYVMDPIRNAGYTMQTETAVGSFKRIAGSFSEPAAFTIASIGAMAFCMRLWLAGRWKLLSGPLALAFATLLMASGSSTAVVSVPVVMGVLYLGSILRVLDGRRARLADFVFLAGGPLLACLALVLILIVPSAHVAMTDFLNAMLFEKGQSESGIARATMNAAALRAFNDTSWIGAGVGSVKTSTFVLAVAANMGVLGLALFGGFFSALFLGRHRPVSGAASDVRKAAQIACLGSLLAQCVSGGLIDLGLPFFLFAALACAEVKGGLVPAWLPGRVRAFPSTSTGTLVVAA